MDCISWQEKASIQKTSGQWQQRFLTDQWRSSSRVRIQTTLKNKKWSTQPKKISKEEEKPFTTPLHNTQTTAVERGGGVSTTFPLLTTLPSWVVDISLKDDVTVILFLSVSFMANKIQSANKSIHEKHFMLLKALYFKINLNVKKYKNVNLSEAAKIRGLIKL